MTRQHVCSQPGCPELAPCPKHSRPKNASWSKDRDPKAQRFFRHNVLTRDNYTCTRCGHHDPTGRDLQAHHIKPGYEMNAGTTLCTTCHRAVDAHAR